MGTLKEKIWKCEDGYHPSENVLLVEDVNKHIKKFKERIKKYYKEDVNSLTMSFDLFCLELNNEFGSSLCR